MDKYISAFKNVITKPLIANKPPIHLAITPTTYCNLKCTMCPHESIIKIPQHMSLRDFRLIIDTLKPVKISLSGLGEPLLNPDLAAMINYAKSKKVSVNTATNGTILEEMADKIVKSGLDLLKVSIDSATRQTYVKIRGQDYFDKIVNGVKAVQQFKRRLKSRTPYIRLQCVLQKNNLNELDALIELAHCLKINAIYFQVLNLSGVEGAKNQLVGEMKKKILEEKLRSARLVARKYKVSTNLSELISNISQFWHSYDMTRPQFEKKCILPWFSSGVYVNGDMSPCCFLLGSEEACMGNILEDGPEKVWNGKKYQDLRKAMKKGARPFEFCKQCYPLNAADMFKLVKILPGFVKFTG